MWMLTLCSLIFVLAYFSNVKYFNSDPELTLLVSQTILENGSTRLDRYQGRVVLGRPFTTFINSPKIVTLGGHYYSYFPTGPAMLSLPFVAMARWQGLDMSHVTDNYRLQRSLAALSVVVVFLIIYQTARLYLDDTTSLIISLTATLGSTVVSTMGTALWSINFATIFGALSLYFLAKNPHSWSRWTPYWLGFLLFLAFLARVSMAAFIAPVLLYLLVLRRRVFWPTAVTALFWLILFLLWSRLELGQWLPAYYSTQRLAADRVAMWVGVYGNLLSPSRGLFIFTPFLALGVLGSVLYKPCWRDHPLVWVILSWFVLLLLIIARGSSWWGGVSFGPRILTEIVPGLTLLLVLAWYEISSTFNRPQRSWVGAIYALLAAFAIFVHSFQGLYNRYTTSWNLIIDPVPKLPILGLGDLFNWQYTQLLASPDWNCAISRDRMLTFVENLPILQDYKWGQAIHYSDELFNNFIKEAIHEMDVGKVTTVTAEVRTQSSMDHHVFIPWASQLTNRVAMTGLQFPQNNSSLPETNCQTLTLIFELDKNIPAANETYAFVLSANSHREQLIALAVNGTTIGKQILNVSTDEPSNIRFLIPGHWFHFQGLNEIKIQLLEARFTGLEGNGYEGLSFVEAKLYPSSSSNFPPRPTPTPPIYP